MPSSQGNLEGAGANEEYPEVRVSHIGDDQVDINIKKSIAVNDLQPQTAEAGNPEQKSNFKSFVFG